MLKHSLISLHPELLLSLNPRRHSASSMEGCTGNSHRVLGVSLPPAPTAVQVITKGLPRGAGE